MVPRAIWPHTSVWLQVVHFTISMTAAAEQAELVLRGKQPLVFHCGFRRCPTVPPLHLAPRFAPCRTPHLAFTPCCPYLLPILASYLCHTCCPYLGHTCRMSCCPIFSEDNRRSQKHKMERYLQPGRQCVATIYAPALFAPAPLLAFLPNSEAIPGAECLAGLPIASGISTCLTRTPSWWASR